MVKNPRKGKYAMITLVCIAFVFFIIPMGATVYLYEAFFGIRTETLDHPNTPRMAQYPKLTRKRLTFPSNRGQELVGYIYSLPGVSPQGLVVLSHGIGGGHIHYLDEINYFAENGYWVFGFDNTGCNESEGENMIGLSQSLIDLDYALRFIASLDTLRNMPILLYGHSWGGYAVCAVLNNNHNVTAVASVAGFNSSINMLVEYGANLYGPWVKLMAPYLALYERIKFGDVANITSEMGLRKSGVQALILHGDADRVISIKSSVYRHFTDDSIPDVQAELLPNKAHNITVSQQLENFGSTNPPNRQLDETIMRMVINFFHSATNVQ